VKAVIFNADDFGARPEVNRAVVRAHREGVLTSASLMINESASAEAIRLAHENPDLEVGLHLVLSDGRCALSPGLFPKSPGRAGIRYFFLPVARSEARAEIAAQFGRFVESGLTFSHVDGHQHLHVHPVIWDEMIRQCEAHGVRCVRVPNEELRFYSSGNRAGRRAEWMFFRILRRRCLRTLKGRGFTVADRVYGHLETGKMTPDYVLSLLERLGGQTNEIYLHPACKPGADDPELAALLSPDVKNRIRELNLSLTSYTGIADVNRAGA